jgi:quercetin dioxygenase-like cupin family protein
MTRILLDLCAALVLAGAVQVVAHATPPSGVSFVSVGSALLPEFDVKRKDKMLDRRIRLQANQPTQIVTQVFTVQPGGYSGWHTHPGPTFFTVRTGTLTVYEGDDPSCTPHVITAETGIVEAGTHAHIHMIRNETNSVAETVVTYLVPPGTPLRIDLPDPGNCPF